jgi:DNA-binding transcriptional regulator YiaG
MLCFELRPKRSRRVLLPFCQIILKAAKPLKDIYSRSFYRLQLKNIGEKLREKRLQAGISQQTLAQKLNTSVVSIRSWEHARTIPNICYLPKLIEFLGYDPLESAKKAD